MSAQSGNVMNAWLIYWCYSTNIPGPFFKGPIEPLVVQVERYYYYYYYYYYRKKRFRWRNVKRLQGHLTNAKNSGTISFQRMFWISDMLPFRNYSESKATAVENRGQDSHFSIHPFPPPVKIKERWTKCLSQFLEVQLGPNTFGGSRCARWEIRSRMLKKGQQQNRSFTTTSNGLYIVSP